MNGSGPARLAYLGTSEFAATVLRRLAASPQRPALVVTPPDRRRGRGRRLGPPPAAETAQELELPLHQSPDVNSAESIAALEGAGIDLGLVCAFGQFLKSRVTEELDAGPVALVEPIAIEPGDDFGVLWPRLAELGGELAVDALELRSAGSLNFTPQGSDGMTYAEKIDPSERALDPRRPAIELERTVRALHPHIGSYLELDGGDRLGVVRAEVQDLDPPRAGELRADAGALVLGCDPGGLRILSVRPPGRRAMSAADYLRGHPAPRLADRR
jgi:methionyl-tRNA formyltransferase